LWALAWSIERTIGERMWRIEYDPTERLLTLHLAREPRRGEMDALAQAHAKALEATGGQDFRVLVDLRGLPPLGARAAALLGDMKRVAARLPGYRGRAVLVDSATVAMQQRNTTLEEGGDPTELITLEAEEAERHVRDL
jgi:hypothetical protein